MHVSTDNTSLLLDAERGGRLRILHYGARLGDADAAQVEASGSKGLDAYPVYGILPQGESAMSVVHADGNMTLDMAVEDYSTKRLADGTQTVVTLRDKVYPLTLRVNYRTYDGEDVIETWTETVNGEKSTVTLTGLIPVICPCATATCGCRASTARGPTRAAWRRLRCCTA